MLYEGYVPRGYKSIDIRPKEAGMYETITIIGPAPEVVQRSKHFFKILPRDGGSHWHESEWAMIKCWKKIK